MPCAKVNIRAALWEPPGNDRSQQCGQRQGWSPDTGRVRNHERKETPRQRLQDKKPGALENRTDLSGELRRAGKY